MTTEDYQKGAYAPLRAIVASKEPLPDALFSWYTWIWVVCPLYVLVGVVLAVLLPPVAIAVYVGLPFANLVSFLLLIKFARNSLEIWMLQHPRNLYTRAWLPWIVGVEGQLANLPNYLPSLQKTYGKNFCCAGQVVLSDFADIDKAMTSGQARIAQLGASPLIPARLPGLDVGPRNVFLLALDDTEADSDHHAFRKCAVDNIFTEGAKARQCDETAKALFDALVSDYRQMVLGATAGADSRASFFTSSTSGFVGFWVKYCHYVLFALDPNDKATQDTLQMLFDTDFAVFNYVMPLGYAKWWNRTAAIEQVTALYEGAPALKDFRERCPAHHCMTRAELARLMVGITRFAAITGVTHLAKTSMGFAVFPKYDGQETDKIDVLPIWDGLQLEDPDVVRRYLLECIRLNPPVSSACKVATEEFTVSMSGKSQTFPAGTKLLVANGMAMVDEEVWGPTTFSIDVERSKLETHFTGFNAVGERSAGRQCPGQALVLETMIKVLQLLGHERRR